MAMSRTEIFQHSSFGITNNEMCHWRILRSCCGVVTLLCTLRKHTDYEKNEANFGEEMVKKERIPAAAAGPGPLFYPSSWSLTSPALLSLSPFLAPLLGLYHVPSLPSFPPLAFPPLPRRPPFSRSAGRLEEESLFGSGIKLLQGIKCNGD